MRSAKVLLEQMGFNEHASESTKRAFLKSLQNSLQTNQKAEVIPLLTAGEQKKLVAKNKKSPRQLCFDLESTYSHEPKKKRS